MQTSYPIFVSSQVLTAQHLNDLVDYLEEQDRLTRSKLIGIGIACGLEINYLQDQDEDFIDLSGGVAVSSEGFLLVADCSQFNRYRPYNLPTAKLDDGIDPTRCNPGYPFFKGADLWELLEPGFEPGPGETVPEPLSSPPDFLDDKVVLLFLECNPESRRDCNVNDCDDRGVECEFTLRTLLIRDSDAEAMLQQEAQITRGPVNISMHPRYDLHELKLEKINPGKNNVTSFDRLQARILAIVSGMQQDVIPALDKSYLTFSYLLADLYPPGDFPNGPFGNPGYFDNVFNQYERNFYMAQYLYDYFYDLVQAYNEFLSAAMEIDAECSPDPRRFPRHVLLGRVLERPTAFSIRIESPGDLQGFDPLNADTGLRPPSTPAELRHHFIPSPLYNQQDERLEVVRSLHYRMYLLAYRFHTTGLRAQSIRITPSKIGDFPLSEKAIPYYYNFIQDDDLHGNWAYHKTIKNALEKVYAHRLLDNKTNHPLLNKLEEHNFYRIEGAVGKSLGQVMRSLISQKKQLGLSFGIEPVYLGINMEGDISSDVMDQAARTRAAEALRRIFACRVDDLDAVFLLLTSFIFYYLYTVIAVLSKTSPFRISGLVAVNNAVAAAAPTAAPAAQPVRGIAIDQPIFGLLRNAAAFVADPKIPETILADTRAGIYDTSVLAERLAESEKPQESLGIFFKQAKEVRGSLNLYDRTLELVRDLAPAADTDEVAGKVYPSIALLDQAEKLADVVSARSLTDFDFKRFEDRYIGFIQAFEAYLDYADKADFTNTPELKEANKVLKRIYGSLASFGAKTLLGNLVEDLQERLDNVFRELQINGFARRHPGLEHLGGVPKGGTLVLFYAHKSLFARAIRPSIDIFADRLVAVRPTFLAAPAPALADSLISRIDIDDIFGLRDPVVEPLDDFIVLADFALPYLCCDTDCSDIEFEARPPRLPPRNPGLVVGIIRGDPPRDTGTPRILTSAAVAVTNLETGQPVEAKVERGEFSFSAEPGFYEISVRATSRKFTPATRIVTISPDATLNENFVLPRRV